MKLRELKNVLRGSYPRKRGVMLAIPSLEGFNRIEQLMHGMVGGAYNARPDFPWLVEPYAVTHTAPVEEAMNECSWHFMEKTDCEYMAVWDHDAVPPSNWFDLFGKGDIVSGLTWMWDAKRAPEKRLQFNQFMMTGPTNRTFFPSEKHLNADSYEVDLVGTHCAVIHRRVFEKLGSRPFHEPKGPDGKRLMGCDIWFMRAARAAGFKVLVIPSVVFGHLKMVELGEVYESLVAISQMARDTGYAMGYEDALAGRARRWGPPISTDPAPEEIAAQQGQPVVA